MYLIFVCLSLAGENKVITSTWPGTEAEAETFSHPI